MKSKAEPKIVTLYKKLLLEGKVQEINWDEFFLLHSNKPGLDEIFDSLSIDSMKEKRPMIRVLLDKSLKCIVNNRNIQVYNACQTLSVVFIKVSQKISFPNEAVDFMFGSEFSNYFKKFSKQFFDIVTQDHEVLLKSWMVNTLFSICVASKTLQNNFLFEVLANYEIFDALLFVFSRNELVEVHGRTLVLIVIMLYHKVSIADHFPLKKLANLEDNVILIGLGHYINSWLGQINEIYAKKVTENESSMWSSFSSKMFNLFARGYEDDLHNEVSKYHSPISLNCLLFLYKAALNNKHFVVALTSPPKSDTEEDLESQTSKAKHTTFTSFLTYCSFVLASFETDTAKNRAKICLLVLWSIVEEPYAQNVMNDVNMSTSVPLYRAPMLHRPASYGADGTPTLITEALYELLTEFNQAHMMMQFPFEHYHLSLSIIHRMLIYQKKYRIRMKKWRPLFNGLVSLLNYLAQHHSKLDSVKSLQLAYRILVVVNFFITYGDTFLPDAAAYDFLYYEISRQDKVFQRLNGIVETRLDSVNKLHEDKPMGIFGEWPSKVQNQLFNILSIIQHIRPKLESIAMSYPTEEQVIEVVQNCFNDLTLKLYDGLEFVDRVEDLNVDEFLVTMTESALAPMNSDWGEEIPYHEMIERLSSFSLSMNDS